jgi:SAM-dependent methyltransferase
LEKLNGIPTYGRSVAEIREHYEVEKALARRLLATPPAQRGQAYRDLYDELFRRIPHHPQLQVKSTPEERAREIAQPLAFLNRFAEPTATYLEIGPGDCALAFAMTSRVAAVIGVDVSEEITQIGEAPDNFRLIISDGTSVPLPAGEVDLAFSDQLVEHLHPDDLPDHLSSVCRVLKPGGRYACFTPNRLTGPQDISRYFDPVATGFHLREYTIAELARLFRDAGFREVTSYLIRGDRSAVYPRALSRVTEGVFRAMPHRMRRNLVRLPRVRSLLRVRIVGTK